ncbi:MAG: hypothetical protein ABIQ93_06020, partial [Saprospiraceae bacterium]
MVGRKVEQGLLSVRNGLLLLQNGWQSLPLHRYRRKNYLPVQVPRFVFNNFLFLVCALFGKGLPAQTP